METEREILVKRAYHDNGKYAISAHCLLRNANRSFLDDRIKYAVNLDTGEVVGSVASDAIHQYEVSEDGIAYQQEKAALVEIQKEWAGISILMFVAKADGQMVKKERDVIAKYLKEYCREVDIQDDILDKTIKQLGAPDQREYKYLVKQIKESGDVAKLNLLIDCARKIIDTGKSVAPFEKAALEILQQAIN
jgi:predicted DNA-binding transcriptional regulator YafY